jgi:hypothetical protein
MRFGRLLAHYIATGSAVPRLKGKWQMVLLVIVVSDVHTDSPHNMRAAITLLSGKIK